ncbi:MAG TPA: SpoIIE family protein phosphatase [Streptosporangiaceae bacterium]|nr:SpoIIE family protein phosphatase [Streptosporangiaceae bacterium]
MTEPSGADLVRLNALVERQRRELDKLRSAAAARSVVDLARGILMEQLGCTPAEAQRQLVRLAAESGGTTTEFAAQITHTDPPGEPPGPGMPQVSLARAAIETAASGNAVARALLGEALGSLGAVAVAIWLTEPDGGLELVGEAGFGSHEASRWRRLPPDMPSLPQQVARDRLETWWPGGPPPGDERPLPGRWRGGAWAGLPLHDAGTALGAMVICWPEPAADFPAPLCRQLISIADVAAQALGIRLSQGALHADHEAAGVLALLDSLLDGCVFARAVRDAEGGVTDFRVDHVSDGFRDPAGRGPADLTGRQLLELYPEAAAAGGLFDRCLAVLERGEPQRLSAEAAAAQGGPGKHATGVRISRLYDGVVIAMRGTGDTGRLAALLQHAQRLGRVGGWEEDVRSGEVSWTEQTFALFGLPPADPLPVADLPAHVVPDDVPAVQGFREALLHGRMESAAAFRVVRADDGSVRQIRAYAEPVTDAGGTVVAMRGVYQDVSADYHTRLAFAAAREQLADTEERAAEEHRLAIRLQEAITPRSAAADELVEAAGLDVAARYRPSGEGNLVSGDWYDTVLLPSKKVLLVVGDIAGHGLDAVTGMVAVRNSLRGLAITGAGPGTLLDWLNSAAAHFTDGVLGTAICGLYDPADRTLLWARAGHLPPVLVRDGRAAQLPLPEGLLLGADPDASYTEEVTSLRLGDTLLLFTDGLIERRDEPIDDAIASLVRAASRPVGEIGGYADHLLGQAASNTGDDACLVAVRVR